MNAIDSTRLTPGYEAERLAALRALGILDTLPEQAYDDVTRLASQLCDTPISLISLIDQDRQWFKSKVGIDVSETPRHMAFCAHAILQNDVFVVEDATKDRRFADNPLVTGEPQIRFYASCPLITDDGYGLGSVCVIDRVARQLTTQQHECLQSLGRQVMTQFALLRHLRELEVAQHALRQSEDKFRSVIEWLAEGVLLLDLETRTILQANRACEVLLGSDAANICRHRALDFFVHDPANVQTLIAHVLAEGRVHLGYRKCRRTDGSLLDVDVSISVVPQGDRKLLAVVMRDVTERRQYEDRLLLHQQELEVQNVDLRALATMDGLTGLINHGTMQARLQEEFDRAGRYGHPLSFILADVDLFKSYNDAFGHPAGDAALRSVAGLLVSAVRTTDILARYGGEEFAIILPHTGEAGAWEVAERCRCAIEQFEWPRRPITASIGVATMTPATKDAAALLQEADEALYRSKTNGRNQVSQAAQSALQPV